MRDGLELWDGQDGDITGARLDTGIPVAPGDKVIIEATGKIWSGLVFFPENGPNGLGTDHKAHKDAPLPNEPACALIAGFGNSEWQFVGESKTIEKTSGGTRNLWLAINDNDSSTGDPNKKFRVKVRVRRKTKEDLGLHAVEPTV